MVPLWGLFLTLRAQGWDQSPQPLQAWPLWLPQHHRGLSPEPPFSFAVTKSKCPSYVGVTGILLQETKHVFKIITKEDRLKGMLLDLRALWAVASPADSSALSSWL